MKKKISILTIAVLIVSVIIIPKLGILSTETPITNEEMVTNNTDTISYNKTYKGKKILEVDTTWGEYLHSYINANNTENDNPRPDISNDCKVRVVKIEYTDGIECKAGFYSYGLITEIFDEKTGELLTSVGYYTDNKE